MPAKSPKSNWINIHWKTLHASLYMPNYEISGKYYQNCTLRVLSGPCASIVNMTNQLLFRHYLLKPSLQYCQKWSKLEDTTEMAAAWWEKKQNKGSLISINSLVVSMSREEQEERGVYSEYCQYNRRAERLFIIKQKLLFSSFFFSHFEEEKNFQ